MIDDVEVKVGSETTHLESWKLLPCPFCGGEAFIHALTNTAFQIRCEGCGAESGLLPTVEEAVDAWNERK